jgi:hypothetical protein
MVETKAMGADGSMNDFDRGDFETIKVKGFVENSGIRLNVALLRLVLRKSPWEHSHEALNCRSRSVKGEGQLSVPAKGPKFVKSGDMIDMFVGVKNAIDLRDFFAEGLFSKIRASIN